MALRKRGVAFLTCLRKRGVPRKGAFPQKRWGSNPGGNYASFTCCSWTKLRSLSRFFHFVEQRESRHKKSSFPLRMSSVNVTKSPVDLVTLTNEILNGKLHFLSREVWIFFFTSKKWLVPKNKFKNKTAINQKQNDIKEVFRITRTF